MPQTAIPTAAGETAGSGRAPHYLLAYLEEGRVRVYAPDKSDIWIGVQLPEAEETRVEAELQRIHRTGQRTGIVEICLSAAGVQRGMRVLCVRA
ncbi:MAG: hypothetical protein EP144_03285 [Alistipes sp.]|nr:hypothetical protein [Alistipes sp.]